MYCGNPICIEFYFHLVGLSTIPGGVGCAGGCTNGFPSGAPWRGRVLGMSVTCSWEHLFALCDEDENQSVRILKPNLNFMLYPHSIV